jgi:hypothetical protein
MEVFMKRQHRVSALYSFLFGTLLLLAAIPAHATFPGANGRIAFGCYNPGVLYTANPDGTDVQPLAFVSSLFSDWRADGKRIVIVLRLHRLRM